MQHLKLIIDTNVVISGALKPRGLERAALTFSLTPPAKMYVTAPILEEYFEVLHRPELRISPAERRGLTELISARSELIVPIKQLAVCHDADDNIFVECAEAARADFIVTGNARHFPKYWKNTKVINARELMDIVAPHFPV